MEALGATRFTTWMDGMYGVKALKRCFHYKGVWTVKKSLEYVPKLNLFGKIDDILWYLE
jgi:hypothetical protein